MYLLPITTYLDYWRATRNWGAYLSGLALFTVGTQYSTLNVPEEVQTMPSVQASTQSSNSEVLGLEANFWESRQRALQLREQGILGISPISRGLANQTMVKRSLSGQMQDGQKVNADQDEEIAQDSDKNQELGIGQEVSVNQQDSTKLTTKITIEDQEIPFETQYIESEELLPGQSMTKSAGEKGIYRKVVKTFLMAGKPVDQQVQSSYELVGPQNEVILRNSKPLPKKKVIIQKSSAIKNETTELNKLNIQKSMTVEATAYTYTGSKTASGVEPREGMVAVDPKVIAMGSRLYVEGYGYAVAADTGGDIRGNRIDVFFTSLRQCLDWGRRSVHIYVLNPI